MLINFDLSVHQEGDRAVVFKLLLRRILDLGVYHVDHCADLSVVAWIVHPIDIVNTVYILLVQNRFFG